MENPSVAHKTSSPTPQHSQIDFPVSFKHTDAFPQPLKEKIESTLQEEPVLSKEKSAKSSKNKILASITNVTKADSLQSLEFGDGIKEVLKTCESDIANPSMESPGSQKQ
ncbi:hypothetical protein H5410_050647 [Solanum commersonii]|uniref:Uncharacterized protein n=1 Tax=Solanum commersonii TaxID=4109 RepID=A0A9J5WY78_SOLCO|nr:hypothetical protein H5410_050647 [Solanum commersonii]